MNTRIAALGDPGSDRGKQADVTDETAAITADALHKLRGLPVPSGESAALAAIYSKVDVLLADSSPLSAALRAGDELAAQSAETKLQADSTAANAASNDYGLTVCGS